MVEPLTRDFNGHPEDFGAVKFVLGEHSWEYRGEGNANIAISLSLERKVVRLPKTGRCEQVNHKNLWCTLQSGVTFISIVMKPLLGDMFVCCPSLIYFSREDVEALNISLDSVRPDGRKHKVLKFLGGELWNDLAFLPKEMSEICTSKPLCIELKPKQGIYSSPEMKRQNCLFCSKQQLKKKVGLVSEMSQYCPLDLFSGCGVRMKHAVKSLLQSPQNNLKIFHDGHLVFSEKSSSEDLVNVLTQWLHPVPGSDLEERFTCLLLQALTKNMNHTLIPSDDSTAKWVYDGLSHPCDEGYVDSDDAVQITCSPLKPPCNYSRQDLQEGSALHRLARAQALDQWGTVQVHRMLIDREESSDDLTSFEDKSTCTEYVQNVVKKGSSSKLHPIESYLIAAAVRDCSVLITLQEVSNDDSRAALLPQVEDHLSNTSYLLRISAVDVNPKPLSTISSHLKRNYLIQEACSSVTV